MLHLLHDDDLGKTLEAHREKLNAPVSYRSVTRILSALQMQYSADLKKNCMESIKSIPRAPAHEIGVYTD